MSIEAKETVGTADALVSFGEAIKALQEGKRVQRVGWNGKGLFVFRQIPSHVPMSIVPKMTSLPQSVKDEFKRRASKMVASNANIKYSNQMAIVDSLNNISSWVASSSDTLSNDWVILD